MKYLVVDVETRAHPDAEQWLEPVKVPGNYKKPESIEAYLAEATIERNERLALDPDCNQIVALGYYAIGQDGDPCCDVMTDEYEEREQLKAFGALYQALNRRGEAQLVTYNGLAFDCPTILRRASLLDISDFPKWDIDRYRSPHAKTDVMWQLSYKGTLKPKSLKFYVKRYGLPMLDRVDGCDIAQLVKDEKWDDISAHCLSDVGLTHALANRLGLLTL